MRAWFWIVVVALASGCRSGEAATRAEDDRCPPDFKCDLDAWDRAPRPVVDQILVEKRTHRLSLVAGDRTVRVYNVAIGRGGLDQKLYEGDGTTPIGDYHVVRRVPSKWHTFIALDYPNDADRRRWQAAKAKGEIPEGKGPGSAIGIHGHRAEQPERLHKLFDWTLGCVALDNDEIDEIAAAAPIGTRVRITR